MAVPFKNRATFPEVQLNGGTATDAGTFAWNVADGTMDLYQEGTILQLGQEQHFHVKNSTGSTITNGTACMATGTDGASGHILVAPMVADGTVSSKYFIGVATQDIANGEFGKITSFGKINEVDTSAFTQGAVLYCSPTTPGALQESQPTAPHLKIATAFVVSSHAVQGKLFIRANAGIDLHENHRVQIHNPDAYGNPQTDGQLLVWDDTEQHWHNSNTVASLTTVSGVTVGTDLSAVNISATTTITANRVNASIMQPAVIYDQAGNSAIYPGTGDGTTTMANTLFDFSNNVRVQGNIELKGQTTQIPQAAVLDGSGLLPIDLTSYTNFAATVTGTWNGWSLTIDGTCVGQSGTISIYNDGPITLGGSFATPTEFKTPLGGSIVYGTGTTEYAILSYYVVSSTVVLVNYIGQFS